MRRNGEPDGAAALAREPFRLSLQMRREPVQTPAQTSSDRVCFAAARFSTRRSFSVFCAGFLPVFFGFADPFIV